MKLDFSQFHPLDHPIWHPYCRSVDNFPTAPTGWKNHLTHFRNWREYAWNDPVDWEKLGKVKPKKDLAHVRWALRLLLWYPKPS